ncbi:MAG TPA: hypothetical protein HPP83_09920 [Candidatus Hydrogenedentes bacterium]|nr:hypothetical protein [Candidatus Hydrogenedentota bacterium]
MNLEAVEQETLAYLKQAANPLVPIRNLMHHLRGKAGLSGSDKGKVLEFLRRHELFRVIEPLAIPDGVVPDADSGQPVLGIEPSVILATRVPTREQLRAKMREELERMRDALAKALEMAQENTELNRADELLELLGRIENLEKQIEQEN